MTAYQAKAWSELFVACAGAGAALSGLVFVAVSINLDRILSLPGIPERGLETIAALLSVVVVSILGLIPGIGSETLGALLLIESLIWGAGIFVLLFRGLALASRMHVERWFHIVLVVIATVPFIIGGSSVLIGSGGGLYWTVAGILGAIIAAAINAWVLLVEILR